MNIKTSGVWFMMKNKPKNKDLEYLYYKRLVSDIVWWDGSITPTEYVGSVPKENVIFYNPFKHLYRKITRNKS